MLGKSSIQLKYSLIFLLAVVLVLGAFLIGMQSLKVQQLRNEAIAVAEQVVSFRAWIANYGVVWVDKQPPGFADFLSKRDDIHGNSFLSKNPALATRELSNIVGKSATRATFRVTSDQYRNPINAPDEFEKRSISQFKMNGKQKYAETFEGGSYRYTTPIYVTQACLACHGKAEDAPPEVIAKYGSDRAFGYKLGDVRGIISVRLPDITLQEVMGTFVNLYTIGLIIVAFLVNFLYTQFGIINRLRDLTTKTVNISKGQMDQELPLVENSSDEIDKAAHSVDMLRKSLSLAIKHFG
ncbi:MAG: DUF3365 domain-containing protein [Sulfuritalea sp.]|nr:DUF3365 domain-containing protein [Sulfuritalea sp.]MDP1981246.1 DUF3365 domain-containing protein [Sulfuritalea sp.]